jgi:hypothetical protein
MFGWRPDLLAERLIGNGRGEEAYADESQVRGRYFRLFDEPHDRAVGRQFGDPEGRRCRGR